MPNWCSTKYIFRGSSNEINYLHRKIAEWTSNSAVQSDFGNDWLGNILYGAGLGDKVENNELRCRGSLEELQDPEDDCLELWTETAWAPMAKMWDAVIEALKLKTVGFAFEAEERGCEIYWIYDPHGYGDFDYDQVYIDAYGSSGLDNISGYYTEEQAIRKLNAFLDTNYNELEDLIKECETFNEEHEEDDWFISVHRFEFDNELQD